MNGETGAPAFETIEHAAFLKGRKWRLSSYLQSGHTSLPIVGRSTSVFQITDPRGNLQDRVTFDAKQRVTSRTGRFVNFYAGSRLISETSSYVQLYYHYDSIGDVLAVTDANGAVRQNYLYDAWGKDILPDYLGNRNKYKAMRGYTDPVTHFVYLGAGSYYNPTWGRTFGGSSMAGYSDAYVYQGDNPLR